MLRHLQCARIHRHMTSTRVQVPQIAAPAASDSEEDEDTLDSMAQALEVEGASSISDVPDDYNTCDDKALEMDVSDLVVVESELGDRLEALVHRLSRSLDRRLLRAVVLRLVDAQGFALLNTHWGRVRHRLDVLPSNEPPAEASVVLLVREGAQALYTSYDALRHRLCTGDTTDPAAQALLRLCGHAHFATEPPGCVELAELLRSAAGTGLEALLERAESVAAWL